MISSGQRNNKKRAAAGWRSTCTPEGGRLGRRSHDRRNCERDGDVEFEAVAQLKQEQLVAVLQAVPGTPDLDLRFIVRAPARKDADVALAGRPDVGLVVDGPANLGSLPAHIQRAHDRARVTLRRTPHAQCTANEQMAAGRTLKFGPRPSGPGPR